MGFLLIMSPLVEYFQSLSHLNMFKSNSSFLHILSDFLVNKFIIEIDVGCVLSCVGKNNSLGIWPVNGSKTHGTWFTTCVNNAVFQVESAKVLAGISDGHNFCMGRWIVQWSDLVKAFTNNTILFDNNTSERTSFFIFNSMKWELDCSFQKYSIQLSLTWCVHFLLWGKNNY